MDAITRAEGVLAAPFRLEDLVSLHRYGPAVSARHLSAVRDERVDERAGAQIVGLDRAATERSIVAHDYVGSGRRAGRAGAVRARVDVLTALRGGGRLSVDVGCLRIRAGAGRVAVALNDVRLSAPGALVVVLRGRLGDRERVVPVRVACLPRGSKALEGLEEMASPALVRELREPHWPVLLLC